MFSGGSPRLVSGTSEQGVFGREKIKVGDNQQYPVSDPKVILVV